MDDQIWADIVNSCKIFLPVVALVAAVLVSEMIQNWLESRNEG